ncbi:hypothetical protein HAX54_000340 [Datura stramonium]|uniref:Uncharacterized protein n=1 Tax=Datura stramonium TaxID=4076 RepID=A0ABS8T1Z7_DATST|nr:hypothetical protein [Datura stramonium]
MRGWQFPPSSRKFLELSVGFEQLDFLGICSFLQSSLDLETLVIKWYGNRSSDWCQGTQVINILYELRRLEPLDVISGSILEHLSGTSFESRRTLGKDISPVIEPIRLHVSQVYYCDQSTKSKTKVSGGLEPRELCYPGA